MSARQGPDYVQLQIAFAGHIRPADLGDPSAIERKLAGAVHRLRAAGVRHARLITGLADGADQLAAKVWTKARMGPVHGVLPFLNEGEEMVGARRLARTGTWLDGAGARGAGCNPHLVQTRWMLSHSDMLVVVWNGQEGRGAGGTADAVRLAMSASVPILWVNPLEDEPCLIRRPTLFDPTALLELHEVLRTGKGSIVTFADAGAIREALELADPAPEPAPRPETGFDKWLHHWLWRTFAGFQRLAGGRKEPSTRTPIPPPPDLASQPGFATITQAFHAADLHAGRLASVHRSEQILLLSAAVLAATIGAVPFFDKHLKEPAIIAELILALAAFGVWFSAARARYHEKWTGARRLAEHLRLAQAGWALGVTTGRAGSSAVLQEHRRLGRSALRQAPPAQGRYGPERVSAWAAWAIDEIISGQADYHRREGRRNERIAHFIHKIENFAFGTLVVVLGVATAAVIHGAITGRHVPDIVIAIAGAVGVITPAIGAAAMALEAKLQFGEQSERSAKVADSLQHLADALPGDMTLEAAQAALRGASEVLVAEAEQWQEAGSRRGLFRGA